MFKITAMKKIFVLLVALLFITGCDDGNMTFKTFNFNSSTAPSFCGEDVLYKINNTEVLILKFDRETLIPNTLTLPNTPRVVQFTLGGSNTITYKNYDSAVIAGDICSSDSLVSTDPVVIDEWKGEGTVTVTTVAVTSGNTVNFSHSITLTDITLTKVGSDEEIRIQDNVFGTVTTPRGFNFDFEDTSSTVPTPVQECPSTGFIFKAKGNEALVLNFPATAFDNITETTVIDLNTSTDYKAYFLVYNISTVNQNSSQNVVCQTNPSLVVTPEQKWVTGITGTIKIVPSVVSGITQYDIYLVGVIFYNSDNASQTYTPPTNISDTNVYHFGTYTL